MVKFTSKGTVPYSIEYSTRKGSKAFLDNIESATLETASQYIDYLYMYHAYQEVDEMLGKDQEERMANAFFLRQALKKSVFIIWYCLPALGLSSFDRFSRLNIGKIPLTNAELVKALFLMKDVNDKDDKKLEHDKITIVTQWDDIERQLHDDKLWYFITNEAPSQYPTRIGLLFDIISQKKGKETDDFYTFSYFSNKLEGKSWKEKKAIWDDLYKDFLKLRDWYSNRLTFHIIGYLITIGMRTMDELFALSLDKKKSVFFEEIKLEVLTSIGFKKDAKEDMALLDSYLYGNNNDEIHKILTLFNVLSTQEIDDDNMRYPFYRHKDKKDGWSLEHIHAQRSVTLNKAELWLKWIDLHLRALKRYMSSQEFTSTISDENRLKEFKGVLSEMQEIDDKYHELVSKKSTDYDAIISKQEFMEINDRFAKLMSDGDDNLYEHKLSNMALLGKDDNALLNNSTFDAKRTLVLEMASKGRFVPICTERVFLKYYTPSENNQMFFWSSEDRDAYMNNMLDTIEKFFNPEYVQEES